MNFELAQAGKANNPRRAVIVSNDGANAAARLSRGVITVVPLNSNVERVYPS